MGITRLHPRQQMEGRHAGIQLTFQRNLIERRDESIVFRLHRGQAQFVAAGCAAGQFGDAATVANINLVGLRLHPLGAENLAGQGVERHARAGARAGARRAQHHTPGAGGAAGGHCNVDQAAMLQAESAQVAAAECHPTALARRAFRIRQALAGRCEQAGAGQQLQITAGIQTDAAALGTARIEGAGDADGALIGRQDYVVRAHDFLRAKGDIALAQPDSARAMEAAGFQRRVQRG